MEKETKIKIIIYAILGALFVLVIGAFLVSGKKKKQREFDERVHSHYDTEFTLDDMLKMKGEDRTLNYKPKTYQEQKQDDNRLRDSLLLAEINRLREEQQRKSQSRNPYIQTKQKEEKKEVKPDTVFLPPPEPEQPKSRFFTPSEDVEETNTIKATIHGEQVAYDGGTIKMRLLEDIITDRKTIPRGTYVFGVVRLAKERMIIDVLNIQYRDIIIPINKTVYDRDGMRGLFVPISLGQEVQEEVTSQGLSEVRANNRRNIADKAVGAVASGVRRVFTKDNRVIRVTVKSNYQLYIKNVKDDE